MRRLEWQGAVGTAVTLVVTVAGLGMSAPAVHAATDDLFALPLHVDGTQVQDANGVPVILNGIHRDGPEVNSDQEGPPRFPTADEIAWIGHGHGTGSWNAKVVRVPVGAPMWLGNCPGLWADPTGYKAQVDATISAITDQGMLALLDLHTTSAGCTKVDRHAMPDAPEAQNFWQSAASRYASNPLVAFELYNEPHWVSDDVWLNGTTGATVQDCNPDVYSPDAVENLRKKATLQTCKATKPKYQAAGMQDLYDIVSAAAPEHLIVVNGNGWATNVPAHLVNATAGNLIYAIHPYTCPDPKDCDASTKNHANMDVFNGWNGFGAPVLVSEVGWPVYTLAGGTYRDGAEFFRQTLTEANNRGWGVIGFAFDGNSNGAFDLILSTTGVDAYKPNTTGKPLFNVLHGLAPSTP